MTKPEINKAVEEILEELTRAHRDIFSLDLPINERLQLLTTESLLALTFVATVEDEFSIEFNDDEVDVDFFNDIDSVTDKIQKHLVK